MRTLFAAIAISLAVNAAPAYAADQPATFQSEQAAQSHCPKDTMAWLNIPTGIMHYKGQRWYGRTDEEWRICLPR